MISARSRRDLGAISARQSGRRISTAGMSTSGYESSVVSARHVETRDDAALPSGRLRMISSRTPPSARWYSRAPPMPTMTYIATTSVHAAERAVGSVGDVCQTWCGAMMGWPGDRCAHMRKGGVPNEAGVALLSSARLAHPLADGENDRL